VTLVWPWALLGLLAIPVLILLERRRRRPRPVVWPSLLLWRGIVDQQPVERSRVDPLLLLECLAVALLALAAADPALTSAAGSSTVVVVLDAGPAMQARRADGRTALEATRAEIDRIEADTEVIVAAHDPLDVAMSLGADRTVVVATGRADAEGPGHVVVGRAPQGFNVGIDAVVVRGERLWFALATDGEPREFDVAVGGRRLRARTGRGVETAFADTIRIIDPGDNYAADNAIALRRPTLRVRYPRGAHALEAALKVGIAVAWSDAPDLVIETGGGEPLGRVRGADCRIAPGVFEGLALDELVWPAARGHRGAGLLLHGDHALARWDDEETFWLGLPVERDWGDAGTLAVLLDNVKRARMPLREGEVLVGDAAALPAPGLIWTRGVDRPYRGGIAARGTGSRRGTGLRAPLALLAAAALAVYLRAMLRS
jgi:hypothetical protein